jgi:hypothetical protein
MSPVRHGRFALALAALFTLALIVASCGGDEDSGTGVSTTATVTSSGEADDGPGTNEGSGGGDDAGERPGDGGSTTADDSNGGDGTPPAVLKEAKDFGSEASGSEADEAEAALIGYLEARAGGEWSRACSYLAKELRKLDARFARSVAGGADGCPGFVATTTERLSPGERSGLAEVDIQSVRLEGRHGYIVYISSSGTEIAKPILEEGGRWKLSSLLVSLLRQARSQE